jgi:hypothetical protein
MLWRRFLVRSDSTLADLQSSCRSASTGRTSISIVFAFARKTTPCHASAGSAATMHGKSSWPTCTFASMNASCMSTISAISGNTSADRETVGNRDQPVPIRCVWEVNGPGRRRIAGDRKRFWIGAPPRRGESENGSMTYWKTSTSGIPKLSITASRSCSLGKSGSCCIALTDGE